jgi:hypothetical protein
MDGFLLTWKNLDAEKFAAYGPKVDLAKYGLKSPALTVTVTMKPADKKAKPVDHTLALGQPVPGKAGERYALLDKGPGVAILKEETVRVLSQTYLDFVNRQVWKLAAKDVTGLVRQMGGATLEVAKKGDGWQIVKPASLAADSLTLDRLTGQLAGLTVRGTAAYPAKDLKPFGLDQPAAVITLRLTGPDKKPVEYVLKIGKPNEEGKAKGSGERFAMADKSNAVYILPGSLAGELLAGPLHFRDRTLARVSNVDRIRLERGPRKAVFARVDGNWRTTEPVEDEVEVADLEEFLKALAPLRADELVAEKPASLAPYGLDRPEARWHFLADDKEVLSLLVGNHEKVKKGGKETEGPRCYAKLAGGDLVFLLDAALTSRFLGEYRSRTVWTGVDAAQVEQLRYGYPKQPFALSKVDNDWRVEGMPAAKVKTEAVTDALDALAGLKAARFVVDKATDFKPYGLAPPQLVVEVKLRGGVQKVLHIGRPEGGSKRYYARVVEGENAAVFIIAEADAKRIVRALKDFTSASK